VKITAALVEQPSGDFILRDADLSEPRDDEILVRIEAVGVCHTDIGFREMSALPFPIALGHEGAGTVEQVGESVTKVVIGDKVLITFRSCGSCALCRVGQPAYCIDWLALNVAGRRPDGSATITQGGQDVFASFFAQSSFASHALAVEGNVVRLPEDADPALYAPFGCGVQTGAGSVLRSLDCRMGATLLVIGAGTVGLSAVLAAKVRGLAQIIVVEPLESRRSLALQMGADHAVDPAKGDLAEQVLAHLPQGVDYAIDTSGNLAALGSTLVCLGKLGTLGLVGLPKDPAATLTLSMGQAIASGLTVRGIMEGDSDPNVFIPELVELHRTGRFAFEPMVKTYPFANINEAISDQASGRATKVVLKMKL